MKVIILAGGLGTRISEETKSKPKPMVLLGDKPILWHVMNIYASQGFSDFVIAAGYKSEMIQDWINNLETEWSISVVDTGLETQTAGRIRMIANIFSDDQFMVTYGDGVGNINLKDLIDFHNSHGKLATVTAVRPPARFGYLKSENNVVTHFGEKNQIDEGWINGGFFVLEPNVNDYVISVDEPFETGALVRLANESQLMAYHHEGFWQPMDTLREKNELTEKALLKIPPWLQLI